MYKQGHLMTIIIRHINIRNIVSRYNKNSRSDESCSHRKRLRNYWGSIEEVRFITILKEVDRWKRQMIELCSHSDFDSKRDIPRFCIKYK